MKRNYSIFAFAALAAATLLSSCQADVDKRGRWKEDRDSFTITLNCPASDSTRTDINGLNPVWKSGDAIWISDGVESTRATIPAEFDGKSYAEVNVSGVCKDSALYALYPYDENASIQSGRIIARIPTVQDGHFGQAHLAVGKGEAGTGTVNFHNASAVLKMNVTREDVWTMQLQTANLAMSNYFKLDPETGAKAANSDALKKVRLDINGKKGDLYLSLMEVNLSAKTRFTFITGDGRMGYFLTSQKNTLENGTMYDMGNIDNLITLDETPATDLSEEESANCYIVNKGGSYRFKAVYGNSKDEIKDIAYGDIVWETVNTTKAPAKSTLVTEVAYSNGYMYLRLPDNVPDGNALVCACDEFGKILWSWHIWILKDGVKDQVYSLASLSGATMMDRNLGALSAQPGNALSLGFMYQWGRKDPFMGSAGIASNTAMALAGTATKTVAGSENTGNLEYATSNPFAYIYKQSSDWLQESDLTLWDAGGKTMYDPCPPGYHVPFESAFEGLSTTTATWDATKYGRSVKLSSSETVWFPYTGYRQSASGGITATGTTLYMYYDENSSETGKNAFTGTDKVFGINSNTNPHASGFPVRCQKYVSSGILQTVTITQEVSGDDLTIQAPYIPDKIFKPASIVWGDGISGELASRQLIYHNYKAAGTYSLVIECYDTDNIKIGPVRHITDIDLSSF